MAKLTTKKVIKITTKYPMEEHLIHLVLDLINMTDIETVHELIDDAIRKQYEINP